MKYAAIEDVIASFPHPILPTVRGGYHTIHTIHKLLQTNARAIDTHLGGGGLGHQGIIISPAAYAIVAPTVRCGNSAAPGRRTTSIEGGGTAAQISAAKHLWEENVNTFRAYCAIEQAIKKQIITVFEPMYLDILNDDMFGFANISAREIIDHLLLSYGSITVVDL
jgi:hypothetical protein